MKKTLATFLFTLSASVLADINLYGLGGPHTALQEAAALYSHKTGVPVKVHFGPQAKWNNDAKKCRYSLWRIRTVCSELAP